MGLINSSPDDDGKRKGFKTRHLNAMSDKYVKEVLNGEYKFVPIEQGDSTVIDEYKKEVIRSVIQTRVQIDDVVYMTSYGDTTMIVNVETCEMTSFSNKMHEFRFDSDDDDRVSIIIDNIETHDSITIYENGKMLHDSKRVQRMAYYSSTSRDRHSFAIYYNQFLGYVNISVALMNVALTEGRIALSCIGYNRTHEIHHVVPIREGGSDSRSNLVVVPLEEHKRINTYFARLGYNKPDSDENK